MRLTARARLALLQTTLVLAAGAALTGLTYLLMKRRPALVTHLDPAGSGPQGTMQLIPPQRQDLHDLADRVQADTLAALLPQAGLAFVVVTVLAALLAWLVAGRVLRPIRLISSAARRLSAENLTERVPVTTPPTSCRRWRERSTTCWTASIAASPSATGSWTASGCSPPMPPTSCAPR
ncbi:HAMP domain-containing protein [Nonomuraea sp. NPDC050540]|uniref:HAMP domain-containing protein n=1 Tax=Nonomuraea sp. NPDC050540 TaxID=3364367 RepID=UPI00379A16C4